jgi:hypothetical protein
MRCNSLHLAAGLLLAPAALSGQDADARVEAALGSALEAGIPVSLLEGKIAEGKAKGVPMDRIATAVEQRLDALTRAREALTQAGLTKAGEGELSVAADAVQAGVSQRAVAEISQRSPDESRAVAIAVLTDLVAMGHVPEHALRQVEAALARGPEALANLPSEAAGRGGRPDGIGARGGEGAPVDPGAPRGRP